MSAQSSWTLNTNASTSAAAANSAAHEPMRLPLPDRDEQVKIRFLAGTLNVGPALTLQRHAKPVSFHPKGSQRTAMNKWFDERGIHKKLRSMNAQLIINKDPVPQGRRLSNDKALDKAPFDRVEVILYPCRNQSITGKKRGSTIMQTHEKLPDATAFYMRGVGKLKGDLGLLRLVQDTVKYKRDVERAHKKTFETPWPEDLVRAEQQQGLLPPPSVDNSRPLRQLVQTPKGPNDAPTPAEVLHSANEAVAHLLRQIMGDPVPLLAADQPGPAAPSLHKDADEAAVPAQPAQTTGQSGTEPSCWHRLLQLSKADEAAFASVYEEYISAKSFLYPEKLPRPPHDPGRPVFHLGRPEALPPPPPPHYILQYERGRLMLAHFGLGEQGARAYYQQLKYGHTLGFLKAAKAGGGTSSVLNSMVSKSAAFETRSETPESPLQAASASAARKRQRVLPKKAKVAQQGPAMVESVESPAESAGPSTPGKPGATASTPTSAPAESVSTPTSRVFRDAFNQVFGSTSTPPRR